MPPARRPLNCGCTALPGATQRPPRPRGCKPPSPPARRPVPFGDGVVRAPGVSLDEGYRQYDDLGLRSIRLAALPGRASAETNGRRLADAIQAESIRQDVQRIVVIGYSKGVVDTLHALAMLQRDGGVPPKLTALVAVAGVVMGTPLADFYQPVYDVVSPWVTPFECTPSRGGDMDSLTRRARLAWLAANPPPARPTRCCPAAPCSPRRAPTTGTWPSRATGTRTR